MHKELEKTMIVSSYAPPSLGGPQNLYNLLRDADPNSYCILTSFYNINNLSAKVGTWLKGEYIFYDSTSTQKMVAEIPSSSKFKKRVFLSKVKYLVKSSPIVRGILGTVVISTQITAVVLKGKKVIRDKNISSIVGFSDYGPAMIGSYLLHKISKKRYFVFIFDIYKGNSFPFPGNLLAKIFEPPMFKSADKIIVGNEGTRDFYIKRYGQTVAEKIEIIRNSTFPEPYTELQKEKIIIKPVISYTIVFTGHVGWPQLRSIKNLIAAVNEIDNVVIKIYAPDPEKYLKEVGMVDSKKVTVSVAPPKEMPRIQSSADILFIPLSWQTQSQSIVDTATPTKLIDYLIAGKPILIHAPASSFLVTYARENNFALIVDEENKEKLKESIKILLTDKKLCAELVENAKATFAKNHDAHKNAILFQRLFKK